MCDIVEEYARQRAEEAERTSARKFFENGATYEMVRASIDMLSDEELQSIYEKVTKENNKC